MALKPGHDGSVAVVKDRRLVMSLESEKDSAARHSRITLATIIEIAQRLDEIPDVIALGGWIGEGMLPGRSVGAGYHGTDGVSRWPARFFGKNVEFFTSSHDRSHLMMALGMAPRGNHQQQAVLVWEGDTGEFLTVDRNLQVERRIEVLTQPGARYSFLFALADPTFPDSGALPRLNDAGKLMALAAYGNPRHADTETHRTIERILKVDTFFPAPKAQFRNTPLYNAGVEAAVTKHGAALLSERIFEIFAEAATNHLPAGLPLRISGGCGLNCEWNAAWRNLGHFSSTFVPPCPNDSGSAIGTAADALATLTGDPHIDWNVYSGLEFVCDDTPDPATWEKAELNARMVAQALAAGHIVAWVQGRWEIGPRALGNRSILAEPFSSGTRERLNQIKKRESYRPIAPCCRIEDVGVFFEGDFPDPYMLYFRKVRSERLGAVTHVDGSARVQTVSQSTNRLLHDLLSAFATQTGVGVLCNTSLNFHGYGFINRMSDLVEFCDSRGIDDMIVGNAWFRRIRP